MNLNKKWNVVSLIFILIVSGLFYYQTFLFGKLPVPTDTLIGLYHPWRDVYSTEYPNGIPYKNFLITDPIRQQIPWRKLVVNQWKNDHRVGWDPTSFGGSSLIYNFQAATWYPLNIIFLWLPFSTAWTVLIISQTVLFLLFSYIYLIRKKIHPLAALFGSMAATFSGFSIAWLTWGTIVSAFMWLPLILASIDAISVRKSKLKYLLWLGLLTISCFCSLTAGHIQTTFYVFLVASAYALWTAFSRHSWKTVLLSVPAGLITLLISLPVLPGFFNNLLSTVRSSGGAAWNAEGFFIPLRQLIQFIIPDFFGNPATLNYWGIWNYGEMVGYVGIISIIFALLSIKQKFADKWFFVGSIVVALLFATENPLSYLPYLWKIPLFSLLQPTRLLAVVCFGLAVLAAYGIDAFIRKQISVKHLAITTGMVGTVFALILIATKVQIPSFPESQQVIAFRNTLFPIMIFIVAGTTITAAVVLRKRKIFLLIIGLLLALTTADLLRFGWKFTPFTSPSYFFPDTELTTFLKKDFVNNPFRVLVLDPRILPTNTFSWYSIEAVGGYNPFYSQRYARYVQTMESGFVSPNAPDFQRIIEPTNVGSPLFKYFNVRYLIRFNPPADDEYTLVSNEGGTSVYEAPSYLPRWYLAETVTTETDALTILEQMLIDKSASKNAFVETDQLIVSKVNLADFVSLISYTPNTQVVKITNTDSRYLVNLTAWDPNWHAYIDDLEATIMKTNYLFMGVNVPAGEHIIEFRYL